VHLCSVFAWSGVVLAALAPSLCAQEATGNRHTGVPQDWSQHHIVFSRDTLALHPNLIYQEPRVRHQVTQRWQAPNSDLFRAAQPQSASADNSFSRDWSVFPLGGHVLADQFPAKFSFDPAAPPSCTNDWVVFGLATASTGTQANLVAFNNLYVNSNGTGFCSGITAPTVMFAYNITTVTGGKITTSPTISLDGTKIAFVESVPANALLGITPSAIFHVLTWKAGEGAIGAAHAPTMTSLTFSPTKNDTASSPWIDYGADTAYVGASSGAIYKITGVFKGTPTLAGSPWPITLPSGAGTFLPTSPVLDSVQGLLMAGSTNGDLYQINLATNVVKTLPVGAGPGRGIVAAPIVDVTNGTTFVVTADGGASAVLVQVNTASMTKMSTANLGMGDSAGVPAPALNLYEPAFSNDYYTLPSTGVVRLCGTSAINTSPWQYAFGFTGTTMNTTNAAGFPQPLSASATDRCSGWTEFFNVPLGVDFFFFGLTQDCTLLGILSNTGCVVALSSDPLIPTALAILTGGPSGIIVDNYSTKPEASSIYMTAEGRSAAYKFTQNGLK
jgi:hypothetical protein